MSSTTPTPPATAARTLVSGLLAHRIDRVFCVAGESYLPVLDALFDTPEIDVVTCRHEASAAFAALTDGKLTGRAGVCFASRGPGAANAAIAVHAAAEDASPLILFVGDVPGRARDRGAFQEIDCARFFGGIAKAVWTLHNPDTAGELLARSFRTAESGTPGPVVVALPEDVLGQPDAAGYPAVRGRISSPDPAEAELQPVRDLLDSAHRPLLLAGELLDHPAGRTALAQVAEHLQIPVITANKQQHLLPNRHPAFAGHLHNATSADRLAELGRADLVLAVGTRLDTVTTRGHRFPRPDQPLVHVHPDPARIGGFHPPVHGLTCAPTAFLRAMAGWPSNEDPDRGAWLRSLAAAEAEWATWRPIAADDGVVFGEVASALDELTEGDLTVVMDSGTFSGWIYRYLRFGPRGRLVGVTSSSMGFGMGAGISAALRAPDGVPTVVVIGDGGFMMNAGELITAHARRLPLVYVLANNGSYATIRLHQERDYPGRVIGTDLHNPDFVRLAESCGALALQVTTPEQLRPALAKALGCGGPAVVEVRTSLEYVTATRRIAR